MNDPWTYFKLDRSTATLKQLKSAYAQLLKIKRPDQDPEGFQELRRAYEAALSMFEDRGSDDFPPSLRSQAAAAPGANSSDGSADHGGTSHALENNTAPSAVQAAVAILRESISSRIRQRIRDAMQAFDTSAEEARLSVVVRGQLLLGAFGGDTKLFAELCTNDRLMHQAAGGDYSTVHLVVASWWREGEISRLIEFAEIMRRSKTLADEAGASLMMDVATKLGRWDPSIASALANAAYPSLAQEQRARLEVELDHEVAIGHVFTGFPEDHKAFWFAWLDGKARRCAWRDHYSRQLLLFVLTRRGGHWPGFALLQQAMPPEDWASLVHSLRLIAS